MALLIMMALLVLIFGIDSLTHPETLSGHVTRNGASGVALFLLIFIVIGNIIPPVVFVVVAGLFWPFHLALLISFIGGIGTAVLSFVVSRHAARDFFNRHIPRKIKEYSIGIRRHGFETTIMLRLLFFLFPPVNWLLGISQIKTRDYILGTALGCLPGMVLYTYIGNGWLTWLLEEPLPRGTLIGTLIITCAFANFAIQRWLKNQRGDTENGPTLSLALFVESVQLFITLCLTTFFPPRNHPRPSLKRCLIMLFFLPVFALTQLCHWFALIIDELIFPRYRRIHVLSPVFIVGIPRSGTTHLHRVLAQDTGRFAPLQLWHVLLAPAICERKLLQAAAHIDRRLGRPLERLVTCIISKSTSGMDAIHKLSLRQPEEDFVVLMPVLACFILTAAFPQSDTISELARFDTQVSEKRRRRIMAFYRGMLQRHLYCVGNDRTILSKNVSFTPMLESLLDTFPDAHIIVCLRPPQQVVPSQISAMENAWLAFGNRIDTPDFPARWLKLLDYYYQHLAEVINQARAEQTQCVFMTELKVDLEATVKRLYAAFGFTMNRDFMLYLSQEKEASKTYRSQHSYSMNEYGLSTRDISQRFAKSWQRLQQCHPAPAPDTNEQVEN
ncbi:MAG: sulfotransferase [Desulfurivibrio sp.]|nr:sulfotransferase [Desulfurivibrio sp.]